MKAFRRGLWYLCLAEGLLAATILVSGCAQKAKMIQVGATQFATESVAAIDKIDELRRKETEATPLPPEKASQLFVDGVKNSNGICVGQSLSAGGSRRRSGQIESTKAPS